MLGMLGGLGMFGMVALGWGAFVAGCTGKPESSSANPTIAASPDEAQASAPTKVAPEKAAPDDASPQVQVEAAPTPGPSQAGTCPERDDPTVGIAVSPAQPGADTTVRVVAATLAHEAPLSMRLEVEGRALQPEYVYRQGIPAMTIATLAQPTAAQIRVVVGRDGQGLACAEFRVRPRGKTNVPPPRTGEVWPIEREWSAAEEALFSAWVRELFHAPRGQELAWTALHEVTSDPARNLLYGHLGWSEDDAKAGLYLRPDCADAPYFLRAYFAWKRRLPFGFRKCSRGAGKPPRCGPLLHVADPPADASDGRKPGQLGLIERYFRRTLAWGVHSGNGRPSHRDDRSDFYPLQLARKALRPGVIYADPYGHIFVVVELAEASAEHPGILYAIDGQPDGSITRKRFWEGNFLWNPDSTLGGSGFKGFRPHRLVDGNAGGGARGIVAMSNAEIERAPGYQDIGFEQESLSAAEFYDRMDALITPGKRDPLIALREAIDALREAAIVRVTSVDNGEQFVRSGGTVTMPDGYAIFETTGAWENYSTPARDLRLLIAIDLVLGFDNKVARNPDVFGDSTPELAKRLAEQRDALLRHQASAFAYTRSDGSKWTLSLAELVARAQALEVGYNPNDCPEVRWGAPPRSEEGSTCRRRAPREQLEKMQQYRAWFRERRRPARGDREP